MSWIKRRWLRRRNSWWWSTVVIVVPIVTLTAVAVLVLVSLVDVTKSADRLEMIKVVLAVGAGTGAVITLVLALRRQEDANDDAAERRITELYTKAVDQLGSEHAAVRLGGLYALERLGNANREQQETIGNVICAYLRMPFAEYSEWLPVHPGKRLRDRNERSAEERETRQAALDIIKCHHNKPPHSWPLLHVRLQRANLVHAHLNDANLVRANLRRSRLNHAYLRGADLTGAILTNADLTAADLTGANLTDANLTDADLTDAILTLTVLTGATLTRAILPDFGADSRPVGFDGQIQRSMDVRRDRDA